MSAGDGSYTVNQYGTMYLDGLQLPNYGTLREITQPNVAKNITLDGSLYVDFYNNRRSWELSWKLLKASEYDSIRAKYDLQFSSQTMLQFVVDPLGLFVPVYITINEKNIKWNGQLIEGFSITLEEQYAIS